jgi:hypothetical protein
MRPERMSSVVGLLSAITTLVGWFLNVSERIATCERALSSH